MRSICALLRVLATASCLLRSALCVFEGFRYVVDGEILEVNSDPLLQTNLGKAINTLRTEASCPFLTPSVASPQREFSNADIKKVLSVNFVSVDPITEAGYPTVLFQGFDDRVVLRIYYQDWSSTQDLSIDTGEQSVRFCTSLYNPDISLTLQVVCAGPAAGSSQAIFNYSFSFIGGTLSGNTFEMPQLDFEARVTSFIYYELTDTPKEAMYEQAGPFSVKPSKKVLISTLDDRTVLDLAVQTRLPNAKKIARVFSVQKTGKAEASLTGTGTFYIAVGLLDGSIHVYLITVDTLLAASEMVVAAAPVDIGSFMTDASSYVQIECVSSSINLIYVQTPSQNLVHQCQLTQTSLRSCLRVQSNSLAETKVDVARMYNQEGSLLQVFLREADQMIIKSQLCPFLGSSDASVKEDSVACSGMFRLANEVHFTKRGFLGFTYNNVFVVTDLTHRLILNSNQYSLPTLPTNCSISFSYLSPGQQGWSDYQGTFGFLLIAAPIDAVSLVVSKRTFALFQNLDSKFPLDRENFLANFPTLTVQELLPGDYFFDLAYAADISTLNTSTPASPDAVDNQTILTGPYLFQQKALPSGGCIISIKQCSKTSLSGYLCSSLGQTSAIPSNFRIVSTFALTDFLVVFMVSDISSLTIYLDLTSVDQQVYQIIDAALFQAVDFERTMDGTLYRMTLTQGKLITVHKLMQGKLVLVVNYTCDKSFEKLFQANFALLDTLYVKFIQTDVLRSNSQTMVKLFPVAPLEDVTAKLTINPRTNITGYEDSYACSTNTSDVFQTNSSELIAYNYINRLFTKVLIPAQYSLVGVSCGSSDYVSLCLQKDSSLSIGAARISVDSSKRNNLIAFFPATNVASCSDYSVTDFAGRVYLHKGLDNYVVNARDPELTITHDSVGYKRTITPAISNWNSQSLLPFQVVPLTNELSCLKFAVDFSVSQFDLDRSLQGNIFQIDLNTGGAQKTSLYLTPRLEFVNEMPISNFEGLLSFAQGTADGSYCYYLGPGYSPGKNATFLIAEDRTTSSYYQLEFWSRKVIDYRLFAFDEKKLSLLVLYYDTTVKRNLISVIQRTDKDFQRVTSIEMNQTLIGVEGMYDFGSLVFLVVAREIDHSCYTVILSNTRLGDRTWFRIRQGTNCSCSSLLGFLRIHQRLLSRLSAREK